MDAKTQKTPQSKRRTKRDFTVIHGAEYSAFCNIRKNGARSLSDMKSKISNIGYVA